MSDDLTQPSDLLFQEIRQRIDGNNVPLLPSMPKSPRTR